MKHNDHLCHGGPCDGCKVTYGSGVPDMPETIYMRPKPNEDGFQPWSRKSGKRFFAQYTRKPNEWGHYYFGGFAGNGEGVV